jgi:hypothetical protein
MDAWETLTVFVRSTNITLAGGRGSVILSRDCRSAEETTYDTIT